MALFSKMIPSPRISGRINDRLNEHLGLANMHANFADGLVVLK